MVEGRVRARRALRALASSLGLGPAAERREESVILKEA
jgi:hypothetical protein